MSLSRRLPDSCGKSSAKLLDAIVFARFYFGLNCIEPIWFGKVLLGELGR